MRTPTSADRLAAVKAHTATVFEGGDVDILLAKAVNAKRNPAVPGVTLLTGAEHVAKIAGAALAKQELEEGKEQRRESRLHSKEAKLGAKAAGCKRKPAAAPAGALMAGIVRMVKKPRIVRDTEDGRVDWG